MDESFASSWDKDRGWNTIGFEPAPPGWRVIMLYPEERKVYPIAGWLIQEGWWVDHETDQPSAKLKPYEEISGRERRVIPGYIDPSTWPEVWPVDDYVRGANDQLWQVLGPGQDDPTAEEEAAERERRAGRNTNAPPPRRLRSVERPPEGQ